MPPPVYFGGVSEFSSIFLSVLELFRYYPPASLAPASSGLLRILETAETCCQASFVTTFVLFRIVGWTRQSVLLLSDGAYLLKHDLLRRHRPGSEWFLKYLMTMSLGLGALQVFWLKSIAEKVLEASRA